MWIHFSPESNEHLAGEVVRALNDSGDPERVSDLRWSWRARRARNQYGAGRTARLPAQFVPAGTTQVRRGHLTLNQGDPRPSWDAGPLPGGKKVPVTVLPGDPSTGRIERRYGPRTDGLAWSVQLGGQAGLLVLPSDYGLAFTAHLTERE